jgi:hypothetical protein
LVSVLRASWAGAHHDEKDSNRSRATNGLVSLLVLATIAIVDGYSRSCEDPSKYPTVNLDRWI